MNTQVNFRSNKKIVARTDKIFKKMGMDRSTAINMFLSRVEAERGLPFEPTANRQILRAKWDREVSQTKKTKGHKTAKQAIQAALR